MIFIFGEFVNKYFCFEMSHCIYNPLNDKVDLEVARTVTFIEEVLDSLNMVL